MRCGTIMSNLICGNQGCLVYCRSFPQDSWLAHTFLSIEFNDGRCISISFEARRVKGERYHPWKGLWRSYELYLLIGYEETSWVENKC